MALMSPLIPEEILNGLILPGYAITQAIVIKKKKRLCPFSAQNTPQPTHFTQSKSQRLANGVDALT